MTPQLQQAIRLLQLSALELRAEIQEALDSNPLLEEAEENGAASTDGDDGEHGPVNGTQADEARTASNDEQAVDSRIEGNDTEVDEDFAVAGSWDEPFDTATAPQTRNTDRDGPGLEIEARTSLPQTLHDYLQWQMRLTQFSDVDRRIAETLIDAINDDGYLTCSIDEIQQTLERDLEIRIDTDEIEAVLHQLQNFDPIGVAARDLRECLLIQLRFLDADTPGLPDARRLVADHLGLLASRDFNQLRRVLRLKPPELQEAVALIQRLNPRPGSSVQPAQPDYVVPDVIVRKIKGTWRVSLNGEAAPRVSINRAYEIMIRRGDNSRDNRYLQDQLQEARWFLKSLQNRNETLLRVATAIVNRQRDFFEHGEEGMEPLVLHDIAEILGMHESTISRVTTHKYMLTPRGIFELKYFFSSHVSTTDGGTRSATAIRSIIKRLIDNEIPDKPISDSKIVEMLQEEGIQVARRTIAKYREHMNIPPSSQRKSIT
jgi:RNA polymerase sigma-54 factor